MRLQCNIEGFEQCYIELSDRWTRRELRDFYTTRVDDAAGLIQKKITAIHIECADGEHITTADQLTEERLEQVDVQVYNWLPGAIMMGLRELENLGFRKGLGRSSTIGDSSTLKTPSPTPSSTVGS